MSDIGYRQLDFGFVFVLDM